MAPNKGPSSRVSKKGSALGKFSKTLKSSGSTSRPLASSSKDRIVKRLPLQQQKTKSSKGLVQKKRKIYTDKELGLPPLNMVTPIGVQKPKGKKKGKVFVDDAVGPVNSYQHRTYTREIGIDVFFYD